MVKLPRWATSFRFSYQALIAGGWLCSSAMVAGCGVPGPADNSHGVDAPVGECGRGLVVVRTDYQSSNVSLVDFEGVALSESLISSASGSVGLSTPLSGDILVPNDFMPGDDVVLIDRYPASVLTWVNVETAKVRTQISVATGFAANARDYVELNPNKAYVTRFETNFDPGKEAFDEGGDVLVVDPSDASIVDSINLSEAALGLDDFLPRPGAMVRAGNDVIVLLAPFDAGFKDAADSRLVRIDTVEDRVSEVFVLDQLKGCAGLAISPDRSEIAVSCSGIFNSQTEDVPLTSGLVRVSAAEPFGELDRYSAADLNAGPLGLWTAYAGDSRLLVGAMGNTNLDATAERPDVLASLDFARGAGGELAKVEGVVTKPFDLGEIRCVAACGECFVTDAAIHGVWRIPLLEDGSLGPAETFPVPSTDGLPPRYMGFF
jgi:hypothetical protein